MDFDILEFENVLKQRSMHVSSLLSFVIFETFGVGVYKDLSNCFGGDVVLVHQSEGLESVGCNHFKVSITAFEVIQAFEKGNRHSAPVEIFFEDLSNVHDHLGIAFDSL